jgi:hypothetical protein
MSMGVQGSVKLDLIGPGYTTDPGDPVTGKPYLRISTHTEPPVVLEVTLNIGEMIGGAATGARKRLEDLTRRDGRKPS